MKSTILLHKFHRTWYWKNSDEILWHYFYPEVRSFLQAQTVKPKQAVFSDIKFPRSRKLILVESDMITVLYKAYGHKEPLPFCRSYFGEFFRMSVPKILYYKLS